MKVPFQTVFLILDNTVSNGFPMVTHGMTLVVACGIRLGVY